jgi:ectoine hydroxylase-related dioxygenase (phytanoyl-CoA dioxygenase family)
MSPNGTNGTAKPKDGKLLQPNEYLPGLPAKHQNTPVEVVPSSEEKAAGRFNDANVKLFLSGMHRDGVVVLKDVIDPEHLSIINDFMVEDTENELRKEKLYKNFGAENIQQGPPLAPSKYFFDDVYLNKLLFHAVNLYLGPNATWNMVSGNNALPRGVKRQPVHSDAMCNHPPAPFYVVANVYTCDASAANGSTEIWLGTHHFNTEAQTPPGPHGETHITDEYVEERKKHLPGINPTVNKGSIMLRDMRLWHAGVCNKSDEMRYMIALGFSASWWHGTAKFRVPSGTGVYERIMHGTKAQGITPLMVELPPDEYERLRDAHDFSDVEKMTYEGEVF